MILYTRHYDGLGEEPETIYKQHVPAELHNSIAAALRAAMAAPGIAVTIGVIDGPYGRVEYAVEYYLDTPARAGRRH